MTQEQEEHLERIKRSFLEDVDRKYRAGAKEHGSYLMDLEVIRLCDEMIAEAIDQYVYATSIKEKLLATHSTPCLTSA